MNKYTRVVIYILCLLITVYGVLAFTDAAGNTCSTNSSFYDHYNATVEPAFVGSKDYDLPDVVSGSRVFTVMLEGILSDTDLIGNPGIRFQHPGGALGTGDLQQIHADTTGSNFNYRDGGLFPDSGMNSDHNIEYDIIFTFIDAVEGNLTLRDSGTKVQRNGTAYRNAGDFGEVYYGSDSGTTTRNGIYMWNGTHCPLAIVPGGQIINSTWDVTSAYSNRTVWRTNPSFISYVRTDTPSISLNISVAGNISCGIYNLNYSTMIINNSDTKAATVDTIEHTCTIPSSEALSEGVQCLYFSLESNQGAASTSGCMNISLDWSFVGTTNIISSPVANASLVLLDWNTNNTVDTTTSNDTGHWSLFAQIRSTYSVVAELLFNSTVQGVVVGNFTI